MNPDVTLLDEVLSETDLPRAPDCEAAVEPQSGVGVLAVPPGATVDQIPVREIFLVRLLPSTPPSPPPPAADLRQEASELCTEIPVPVL